MGGGVGEGKGEENCDEFGILEIGIQSKEEEEDVMNERDVIMILLALLSSTPLHFSSAVFHFSQFLVRKSWSRQKNQT